MTTTAPATARPLSLRSFVDSPSDFLRQRVQEKVFWRVQAAVLGITVLHFAVEALTVSSAHDGALASSLHHLPVLLYIAPVAYAGLAYGYEGGILTGLWCAVLTIPNIVLWHSGGYEWIGEFLFVIAVVAVGTITALPVERERRERRRAEAVARRLAILNDVAASVGQTWDEEETVRAALGRLVETLPLRSACIALWRSEQDDRSTSVPILSACDASEPGDERSMRRLVDGTDEVGTGNAAERPQDVLVVPVTTGGLSGRFVARSDAGAPISPQDAELLATVGNQLALGIENAVLHRQEREGLESYVQLVTNAQEEERKRIARDLHDGAAQQLAALCRQLDAIGKLDERPDVAGRLAEPRELAGAALADLRQFGRDLRPTVLDDLGLVPALEWVVAEVERRAGIEACAETEGAARRLPAETEIALFRIAQEALRNVERHAEADEVRVKVRFGSDGDVRLSVRDDGIGFSVPRRTSDLVPRGKLGIMGMHERALLTGGVMSVRSEPGLGTEVVVHVGA